MSTRIQAVFVAGAVAASLLVLLQRRRRPLSAAPLAFSSCEVHRLTSSAGLAYKLHVSLPLSYSPDRCRYPIVVALDSEPYLFPLLTVCARTSRYFARSYYFPDAIVVGVVADLESDAGRGWLDVAALWDGLRPTRARDYLPTAAESPWGAPGAPSLLDVSGHADEFVGFVVDTLLPFLEARYSTYGRDARALVGKSFGGSGVAHALLDAACARCFSEFVLGSPSIGWDDGAFFRLEAAARARAGDDAAGSPPFGAAVFCCLGGAEAKEVSVASDDGARLVTYPSNCHRLKAVLDGRQTGPRVDVVVDVVEGENHGSVSYPFVVRALGFLKERWRRLDEAGGVAQ